MDEKEKSPITMIDLSFSPPDDSWMNYSEIPQYVG
jgi:hypothetical protein